MTRTACDAIPPSPAPNWRHVANPSAVERAARHEIHTSAAGRDQDSGNPRTAFRSSKSEEHLSIPCVARRGRGIGRHEEAGGLHVA